MAVEVERLIASLEARTTQFEKAMNKALGVANQRARQIESRFEKMGNGIGSMMAGGLGRAFGALGAAVGANEIRKSADSFTKIQNNLKVAGLAGQDLTQTFDSLFAIAQKNAVPIEALSELYGRVSQAQKTLNTNSSELVGFTSIVAQALQVSGKSASEASGALLQLGQALSGGTVQAEEYNSLLDGLYPLLQAAAAGLKEAGGDVAKLTKLVKDGKVSSEAFYRAIEAGSSVLSSKLAGATATTEQGFTVLKNALTVAVGKLNEASGATQWFNEFLRKTGENAQTAADYLVKLTTATNDYTAARLQAIRSEGTQLLARNPGLAQFADPRFFNSAGVPGARTDRLPTPQSRINDAFGMFGASASSVKPVSLAAYPVGGKSSGSSASTVNAYQRETQSIRDKIAALEVEASTIGKSRYEQERAKTAQDLMNAAQQAGVKITPALTAEIDKTAAAYASAKVKVEEMAEAQRKAIQAADEFRSGLSDGMSSFATDFKNGLMEGQTALEAFRNAASNAFSALADQLIRIAMANLVAAAFGPQGTTMGGSVLGALFGGPRAGGGSAQPGRSYMVGERGPERFVPTTAGRIVPAGRSGGQVVIQGDTIDARGADAGQIAYLRQELAARDARLRRELPALIRNEQSRARIA